MAGKVRKSQRNKLVAKLVTENSQPCVFCQQDVDDEVIYGKLYSLGDIQCHYFCVLLSCCLVQKGRDTEGLFGFLYKDIIAEVERSKKHKCSYCGRGGASLGCCMGQCRKQFHLPCGRQRNAVSLFYGNYKSYCELHAPKQKISNDVMANARVRLKRDKMLKSTRKSTVVKETEQKSGEEREESVCVICYEEVQGYPTSQTFWPPCCGRDAWLHRSCLQRMALSAGMHFLRCPLCNDKEQFCEAVAAQGYYLPDRDAAWELEQNAFAEIYERPASCGAEDCRCPFGRDHDQPGIWDVKLCLLCGSCGLHAECAGDVRVVCAACRPAATTDIAALMDRLEEVVRKELAREARGARRRPVMPSRMSLRRTKGRLAARSGTSSSQVEGTISPMNNVTTVVQVPKKKKYRQELNLKSPRKSPKLETGVLKDVDKLLSPVKMFEQSGLEFGLDMDLDSNLVIEKMKAKFRKPRPLCKKKRIVDEIVEDLRSIVFVEKPKSKYPLKEWNSPKKCFDITELTDEDSKENVNIIKTVSAEAITENTEKGDVSDKDTDLSVKLNSSEDLSNENYNRDDNVEMINDINADGNITNEGESSTSTFQLSAEFIAESEDSLILFDTPKKLKTKDIKRSSSLGSEYDEINVGVVKRPSGDKNEFIKNITLKSLTTLQKCSFKFSPTDEETLQTCNVDVDVETFKDQYLSEVDRKYKYNFDLNYINDNTKLPTVKSITVVDATDRKKKMELKEGGGKRKKDKSKSKVSVFNDNLNSKERKRDILRKARELKLKKKDVRLKMKWKDEKDKVRKKQKLKTYKQYVLKYSPTQKNKVIEKPDVDVTPRKRKYIKLKKTPDNLIQTSIQNFFKIK